MSLRQNIKISLAALAYCSANIIHIILSVAGKYEVVNFVPLTVFVFPVCFVIYIVFQKVRHKKEQSIHLTLSLGFLTIVLAEANLVFAGYWLST